MITWTSKAPSYNHTIPSSSPTSTPFSSPLLLLTISQLPLLLIPLLPFMCIPLNTPPLNSCHHSRVGAPDPRTPPRPPPTPGGRPATPGEGHHPRPGARLARSVRRPGGGCLPPSDPPDGLPRDAARLGAPDVISLPHCAVLVLYLYCAITVLLLFYYTPSLTYFEGSVLQSYHCPLLMYF